MEAPKTEEISHPPMDQLQGFEYCIDSNPSWGMLFFINLILYHNFIEKTHLSLSLSNSVLSVFYIN